MRNCGPPAGWREIGIAGTRPSPGTLEVREDQYEADMASQRTVPYLLLLIAVIVVVDVLFFRNRFWPRLSVNVGIVLVFAAFYFRFVKRP